MTALDYDPGLRPASTKRGVLFGMAMTERQGGSDVRSNTTRAVPTGTDGEHLLTGQKWFCSAPMCDAFLVLAQAPGGLTGFLLPRILPDGTRNNFHIQRLKDKLGNRSNASSEVELKDAWATIVGEEGRGVRTIIEMVNHTRLDCVIGSASLMRQAVAQATHHTAHRSAFGKLLTEQPLMANVLADMAIESEATTILMMRLAGGLKHPARHGSVEEPILPRLYREAPLNSIGEGSGNVNALDVLRALTREPESLAAFLAEVEQGSPDQRLAPAVIALKRELANTDGAESRARRIVEQMAVVLQGSL